MIIALDYDRTYTADPDLWRMFCKDAKSRGHSVICVTMRYPAEAGDMPSVLNGVVDEIIFTSRDAKRKHLAGIGVFPAIWIDDCPEFILNGAFRD